MYTRIGKTIISFWTVIMIIILFCSCNKSSPAENVIPVSEVVSESVSASTPSNKSQPSEIEMPTQTVQSTTACYTIAPAESSSGDSGKQSQSISNFKSEMQKKGYTVKENEGAYNVSGAQYVTATKGEQSLTYYVFSSKEEAQSQFAPLVNLYLANITGLNDTNKNQNYSEGHDLYEVRTDTKYFSFDRNNETILVTSQPSDF